MSISRPKCVGFLGTTIRPGVAFPIHFTIDSSRVSSHLGVMHVLKCLRTNGLPHEPCPLEFISSVINITLRQREAHLHVLKPLDSFSAISRSKQCLFHDMALAKLCARPCRVLTPVPRFSERQHVQLNANPLQKILDGHAPQGPLCTLVAATLLHFVRHLFKEVYCKPRQAYLKEIWSPCRPPCAPLQVVGHASQCGKLL